VANLTPKQQAFVEAFAGNATDAARIAGYGGSDVALAVTGSRLLRTAKVRAAIDARQAPMTVKRIATREERQAFWTETMCNPKLELAQRLRASELLGKSNADFIERVEVAGKLTLEQLVLAARKKP
jgi:phage terminase small subunit